jgi:4-alpha-glucanotransferase
VTDPSAWGISTFYEDGTRRARRAPRETIEAIARAMGAEGHPPPPPPVLSVCPGRPVALDGPAEVLLEDGTTLPATRELPPDLPLGYHQLVGPNDDARLLIAAPPACHLPEDLETWGWAVQVYALRSTSSWGIGDLRDLRAFAEAEGKQGAGVTMINPLHAVNPAPVQQASPYFPSSRCYHNPLYISIEEVPRADEVQELPALAAAGRALSSTRRIDRDRVFELKQRALTQIFARGVTDPAFERWRDEEGDLLESYATFAALYSHYGGPPRTWPSELRHPSSAAVARWRAGNETSVRRHAWQQWLLAGQLEAAGRPTRLLSDLAVGVDPDGADAWLFQDTFASGMTVGAPPDAFNADGQSWGTLAFDPFALARAGYGPFIRTVRAALRRGGGLRFDHVMGLWRLFWIPSGASPCDGAYVRYPTQHLLAILALESERAGAFVVGEDLGTVEPGVRAEMARWKILSNRLLWFEDDLPEQYPELALAAVSNHDLPTVPGLWTGEDLVQQRLIGRVTDPASARAIRERLRSRSGLEEGAPVKEAVMAAYRLLARAPSRVLMAQLEDALGISERVNMPGTTSEWPNWSLALPLRAEQVPRHPTVRAIGALLQGRQGR